MFPNHRFLSKFLFLYSVLNYSERLVVCWNPLAGNGFWLFHPPSPFIWAAFSQIFSFLSLWIMRSFVVLDVAFFFSPSSFSKGRFFPVCGRGGKWFTRDRNQQELGNHCATMLTSKHTGQGILRIASLDKRELGILSVLPVLCSE